MTLGEACDRHRIPVNVCVACKGAAEERERIIALLEEHKAGECGFGVTHDLIALIKGEN